MNCSPENQAQRSAAALVKPLQIDIDLSAARQAAERIVTELELLRAEYDLSPFEYTHAIRIAPLEIPHSHPVLTLNTRTQGKTALLRLYLHEQMHWFTSWFSLAKTRRWEQTLARLEAIYPDVPVGFPEGCHDRDSTYLHLIVNLLEIDATSRFIPLDEVRSDAANTGYYRWVYQTVLGDWNALAALFAETGLMPIRTFRQMTPDDLVVAASAESPRFSGVS